MLQISEIKANPKEVVSRLKVKNFDAGRLVDEILKLDIKRRETQQELDDTLARSKVIAKEIGGLFKQGKKEEAEAKKQETAKLKSTSKELASNLDSIVHQLNELIVQLPNIPHPLVKSGSSEDDNEIVHEEGDMPELELETLPHWELAEKFNIIRFDVGSKVTGAGFPFYAGRGARLQRALVGFFLDEAIKSGYYEFQPPLVVNEDSAFGTGQLPDKDGQMYAVESDKLFLIPTAEVPVTNVYRDVILKEDELPVKNVAYSACFRREAGSYGKDVRGLNRLHQFDKVEIVQIAHPDKSYEVLEEMKEHVAGLIRKLELPFRVARLCGGDLSFTSAMTYDFEVWSGAQKRWLEVSSVSNFEAFQANRMKLRFKDTDGKTKLAHTLNGSALALPRIMAALLENNQTSEGIKLPQVLHQYAGFETIN